MRFFMRFLAAHGKMAILILVIALLALPAPAAASDFGSSTIATGTKRLAEDVTRWLLVLAPVTGGLLVVYFFIRRSAADEMDQKKWNNRVVTALISTVAAVIGSAILNLIIGYYT